ncbi:MAG: PAS domain S-box-containing protein [Phenylobacterium sp.]|jgi:PAS domain S-box-containing protein
MTQSRASKNPFLGLRPFSADDSELFFGREGRTQDMIEKLNEKRFLAVVGSSGSGKSSLVGAGLLPKLAQISHNTNDHNHWRIAQMRPGSSPIKNLAKALSAPHILSDDIDESADNSMAEALLESTLRRSSLGLINAVNQANLAGKLLLVVDQFEELFRFQSSNATAAIQANAFVNQILEAAHQRKVGIYICITMRSDFFGHCAWFNRLPEAINEGQYLVPKMTRRERRDAITKPMQVAGAEISNRLLQRLLNDVSDTMTDQLPILQHALMRTYDHWKTHRDDEPQMDILSYDAIGTIHNALNDHAEAIYRQFDPTHQALCQRIFKCLTIRMDNRDIRYSTPLEVLAQSVDAQESEVIAVSELFRQRDCAFLMPPMNRELTTKSVLDISHESLIRIWRRLGGWVSEEAESAKIFNRLREHALLFAQQQADYYTKTELSIAMRWLEQNQPNAIWADRYGGDYEQARTFLEQSISKQNERRALEEQVRSAEAEAKALSEQSTVLRNILGAIPHSVFWKDRNMVYQGANAHFTELAGLAHPDEIVGKTDFDLPWSQQESEYYRECDTNVMDDGHPMMNIEESQQSTEGETFLLTDKVPLRDSNGEVNGILGIFLDITQRKRTEKALEQALGTAEQQGQELTILQQNLRLLVNQLSCSVDAISCHSDDFPAGLLDAVRGNISALTEALTPPENVQK